jgi:hypothetical protein
MLMPKQRLLDGLVEATNTIKRCRVRLRHLNDTIKAKDQEVAQAKQALVDADKGRTLRSHLSSWWQNRKRRTTVEA